MGTQASRTPLDLDWLLDPVAREDFTATFRERALLPITRHDASYFDCLPGIDAIDAIIAATSPGRARSAADALLVRTDDHGVATRQPVALDASGHPDIQSVYRAYEAGATVVVNAVHRRSAVVGRLCRNLTAELHHPVGANYYLSPREAQGFRCHVDDHDVFILQLHGSKQWRIGSPSYELPLAGSRRDAPATIVEPVDLTLAAGDVLYIPRGFPHEGKTSTASSLHLTVGLQTFCWVDLLREALTVAAEETAWLRRGLPPGFLDLPLDQGVPSASRLPALTDPRILEAAKGRLAARLLATADTPGEGRFRSLDATADLRDESVVTRAPGSLCRVRGDARQALIEFAGNYVSGPPSLGPAFRYVSDHTRFAVADLPGDLSREDRVYLVARLVAEGLLSIADGGN
jgi:bifunctional lysine-specific demethylase and histidyl-hydroxylase NO66